MSLYLRIKNDVSPMYVLVSKNREATIFRNSEMSIARLPRYDSAMIQLFFLKSNVIRRTWKVSPISTSWGTKEIMEYRSANKLYSYLSVYGWRLGVF